MRMLVIFFSIFFAATISFAESDFIVNGEIVSEKEYNQVKSLYLASIDTLYEEDLARNWAGDISLPSFNQNAHLLSIDRNSDEFDIHLNFDEQNTGCSWGSDIPPSTVYQSEFGITFGNGPSLINECGNFGVSGHSSPVFIGNNHSNTPGDLLISFDNIVSKVQINAGTNSGTIFQMIGYDENNNQIVQSAELNGTNVLTPLSVTANGIKSIRIITSGGDIFVYDDLKIKTGSYQEPDSENHSLSFDGINDYVHANWSQTMSQYSISIWVKANSLGQDRHSTVFNSLSNTNAGIQIESGNNNNWRFVYSDNSASFADMTLDWVHIAVTASNQGTRIYFNGSEVAFQDGFENTWDQIELGRNRNANNYGDFSVDNFMVWDRVLSSSEIQSINGNISEYQDDNLKVWWTLDEGAGNTINDQSGNNNNAIIYDALWSEEHVINTSDLPEQLSAIKVAVVSRPNNYSTKELVAAQLNDDTYFDFSAVTLTVDQADEISEISDYDVIIIGGSGHADGGYTSSFYSTLNTYMLNGGGILSTGWFHHELLITGYNDNYYVSSVTPFVHNGSLQYGSPGQISIVQNDHPVTDGISNFTPTCNYTEYAIYLDQGAEKLGGLIGVNNSNAIIVHENGIYGRTGYLGGMYIANTTYNNGNMRSGVEDQLLEQMVYWLAGGESNQNQPPVANSFSSSSVEDIPFNIDLTSQDANNDIISYTILEGPFHGEVTFISDSSISYTPFNNFFGLDSFKYVAYDGEAYSEPAMVTIEVTEVNDKPVAIGDHFMIAEDDTLHGELQADEGDHFPSYMNMQDLTYSITLSTLNGALSVIDTSGKFTYTPDENFFGADSFLFSVTDNGTTDGVDDFLSDTAMIHLFVEPMNDAPVLSAFADTSMHEDSTLVLSVFANDIDNAELSVYAYSSQDRVSAFVEDTLLFITPDADWNGTAEIVVVANDNMSRASDVEEFTIDVIAVNDAPFFTMDHFHAMGDITSGIEHWIYADDIDSDIFFILEEAPSWISLDGSKIVGQPEQDGEYVFTLSVSDSEYVVSEQFTVYIADHRPEILSLRDVANDQGKQMQIVWKPGQVDPSLLFTQFSAWRKVNPEPDIVYFTKENNADWTLEENQDRISETVWLTRASNQGIFNIFSQDSYDPNGPSGTSWRWGATLDESHSDLAYTSLNAAILQSGYNVNQTLVQQLAGTPVFSLYLIDNDEYYDVTFTSYFGNNSGGGFSWYHSPVEFQADTSDLWDFIATVPWIGTEDEYSLVVPTLGDSTTHGVHHSTFRVTAHTEDVALYHVSEPVTGFSVDNLHPTVPQGLTALESGSSVVLQWNTQVDEDFSYHNIYKNDLNSADLAMVFTTTDSFYVDHEGTQGLYEYWITAVDSAGNESDASDIAAAVLSSSEQVNVPTVFALEQNYPNPFNPSTQIRYAVPEQSMVTISVYDMMGRKVRTLIQGNISAGYHTTVWNATNDKGLPVGAGMYIYTIRAGTYHQMKKMVLLK